MPSSQFYPTTSLLEPRGEAGGRKERASDASGHVTAYHRPAKRKKAWKVCWVPLEGPQIWYQVPGLADQSRIQHTSSTSGTWERRPATLFRPARDLVIAHIAAANPVNPSALPDRPQISDFQRPSRRKVSNRRSTLVVEFPFPGSHRPPELDRISALPRAK